MVATPWSIPLTALLCGWISYLFVLAIYRLYFHPLAKFPGPGLAALTYGYEFYYDAIKGGMYLKKIEKLHEKYGNYNVPFIFTPFFFSVPFYYSFPGLIAELGSIVRIAPEQLHIKDTNFFDEIYAHPSRKLDKEYNSAMIVGAPSSGFGTTAHDRHRLRRSALNQFFSKRSVSELEPMICSKIEQLCQRLAAASETKEVVQLDAVYLALTMDVVTEYAFGQSANYLRRKDFAFEWMETTHSFLRFLPVIKQAPWLHRILKSTPFFIINLISLRAAALTRWQMIAREQVDGSIEKHRLGKINQRSIFMALLDGDLPAEEKSADRLHDEA
jgi:Cytochrome P450